MRQVLVLIMAVFLVGCNEEAKVEQKQVSHSGNELAEIEQLLIKEKAIDKAAVIAVEDEFMVAIQLKPWLNYKKRSLESDLKKKLEKIVPKKKLAVSTDFKLYHESKKLLKQKDAKEAKKDLEKMKKLMEEET